MSLVCSGKKTATKQQKINYKKTHDATKIKNKKMKKLFPNFFFFLIENIAGTISEDVGLLKSHYFLSVAQLQILSNNEC